MSAKPAWTSEVHARRSRRRSCVPLPSQNPERGLCDKVRKAVRQCKKQSQVHVQGPVSTTESELPDGCSRPSPLLRSNPRLDVDSKYMLTSCVPRIYSSMPRRTPTPSRESHPSGAEGDQQPPHSAPQTSCSGVVEAPTSIDVYINDVVEKVPRCSWILLDQQGSQVANEKMLCVAAGGGKIFLEAASLLRYVPEERLTARAVEANFKRAAKGTSLLALRHAALIMSCVYERDAQGLQYPKILPQPLGVFTSCPFSDELIALVRRTEGIIVSRVQAAQAHARATSRPRQLAVQRGETLPKSMLQKGFQANQEFQVFARRRFGNLIRAWFAMDAEENLRLGYQHFVRRCDHIGFRGNISALWQYLDSDRTGSVTILEIDPAASRVLANFKLLIERRFDGSVEDAFQFMDDTKSNRVTKDECRNKLKQVGYNGPVNVLFDLLDRRGYGFVTLDDVTFLNTWHPPAFLFHAPKVKHWKRIKEELRELHPSLLHMWRKVFDRDGVMRLSWDKFVQIFQSIGSADATASQVFPQALSDIAGVWRAMDAECCGWILLRDFDLESFEALSVFKRWAEGTHGSLVKAFHALDGGNGRLSRGELKKAARGESGCRADLDLVFEGLDVEESSLLVENDVRFLDRWDLDWEDLEVEARKSRRFQNDPDTTC